MTASFGRNNPLFSPFTASVIIPILRNSRVQPSYFILWSCSLASVNGYWCQSHRSGPLEESLTKVPLFLLIGTDAGGWGCVQIPGTSKCRESLCTIPSVWIGYCKWKTRTHFCHLIVHSGNCLPLDLNFPFFRQRISDHLSLNRDNSDHTVSFWALECYRQT